MRTSLLVAACLGLSWGSCLAEEVEDKSRATSIAHLKAIALALHNHHDARKAFPAPASLDKDGKPLLSWRVQILPFLGEGKLFAEFHLDEPWDSEHNKKLIAKMPEVFVNPRVPKVDAGLTTFQVPVGAGTAFDPGKPRRFRDVLDGTANTIMIAEVDAKHAMEWTKPGDLPWDEKKPLDRLYFDGRRTSLSVFVSGDAHLLPETMGPENFRRYFLRDDGLIPKGAVEVER